MDPEYKGFPVDQLIPDGTELTDIQRSYLEATAYLFSKSDHVKMIDVARLMGKPTGSVHSAMMALSQRGILKTDHSGTIRLLSNETEEAEPEEAEPEETEPEKAELKETEPEERETESAGSKKLGTEESIPEESSPDEPLVEGYIVVDGQLVSRQGEIIPDAPFTVLHLSARPYNALAREQNRIKVTEHETLMISDLVKLNRGQLTSLRYAYLFRTYYLERDAFIQAFGQTQQTWYYLTVRYDRGKRPISEALEDPNLSMADRYAVEKFIHRDDFFLDGRYVPGTRSGIEDYLAEKYCQDEMNFDDFMVLCDRFIRENELPLKEVSEDLETQKKTRLNRVSRSTNILWKQNQRLRYYNIEGGDFTELLETLDLSRYHDIEISTQKLMTDHPDVMRRYDIRDEYELHNLLKKIHAEKENPSLVFGRMPGLVFGKFNRDEAVKEIMFALAPVSQEDLVEMISLEYGFRENTIVANLLGCISEYLHHGMYSIEYEDMPQEQMDIMSSVLTDDLYTFEELKDLYLRSVGNPDTTLLSSYNMKRLGYSAGASYFVRSSLSAEEYFDRLLLEKDRVDITEISRRFTGITAFSTRLSKHRHELDILEYEPYKYVNIRLLEKSGFTRDRLRIYADRVCAFIEPFIRNNTDPDTVLIGNNGKDAYFSVISLKNAGFTDELDMLGFGDRFCASILREDDRFSWQRIGGMAVFNPNRTFFTTGKFLAAYVAKERAISLDELILQVYKSFGISIDKSRAQDKVTKDNVYYDPVIQKLYADYETFLKETEELRRNNDETSRLQTDNQIQ